MDLIEPAERRDRLLAAILAEAPKMVLLRWDAAVAVLVEVEPLRRVVVLTLPDRAAPGEVRDVLSAHVKTVGQGGPETTFVAIGGGADAAAEIGKAAPFVQAARMGFYHLDDDAQLAHVKGQRSDLVERAVVHEGPLDPRSLEGALVRGRALVQQEQAVVARLTGRQAVTTAITVVCVALFGLGLLWNGDYPMTSLGRMGENFGPAVRAGEVHRLLASAFLHAGVTHLVVNMIALWSLGPMLEAILGPRRYVLLYGASALGGALASALLGPAHWSVGASGAIWGLMAGMIGLVVRPKGLLPPAMSAGLRQRMWVPLVINVLISFQHGIDWRAHLGGGLVGFALMATVLTDGLVPITERATPAQAERRPSVIGTLAAGIVAAAMVGSVVAALAIGKPWTIAMARVPIADSGLTVEMPNGLRGDAQTKDGMKIVRFGALHDMPVEFQIALAEPDMSLDQLRKDFDEGGPKGWTRKAPAKRVTLGDHAAILVEHDASKDVKVKTWAWPEGGRVVVVRGYSLGKRPPAWEGIEERVAASVRGR